MNFAECPVKVPHTQPTHFGPGSQWGKPYYSLGQEFEKVNVPKGSARNPLSLSGTAGWQTSLNQRHKEVTLKVFGDDPPTHRSCVVSIADNGNTLDSVTHTHKVGSKHLIQSHPTRSPVPLGRSASMPHSRRTLLKDPTPWHFNAAFTTSNDGYGKFYSSHLIKDPYVSKRSTKHFDWHPKL
eukprot:TRINITY_DN40284_c0_g1_i1.p1 TRINITY_DN40284_c0_g1~~TRINITY_DN40284_c0_g1_i1.p1  ORF type:complete len:182 (+),score=15.64 TRINITY_DN40284_c0_g1_i1:69-614(+)